MGIGYNDGGNAYDIQNALAKHKIYYSVTGSKISYSSVKSSINANAPFIMQIINSSNTAGHSLVGIGYMYTDFDISNGILFYDPNGIYSSYNHDSPTYNTAGYTLTWKATIY